MKKVAAYRLKVTVNLKVSDRLDPPFLLDLLNSDQQVVSPKGPNIQIKLLNMRYVLHFGE